jgi:ribosomal protein S18 acetylase RimI-like enzyme
MKIDIGHVRIIEGNLSLRNHQQALIELINAYLKDAMGEGRTLTADMEVTLLSGLIGQANALIFFAEYNSSIIGLAACFFGFSTFYAKKLINIHDLIVLPEYRRRKVAEKIILFVEKKARDMDCCKLTLEVRADNIKAMGLYKKLGFSAGAHPMYFWRKIL